MMWWKKNIGYGLFIKHGDWWLISEAKDFSGGALTEWTLRIEKVKQSGV